jgi:hypothetical protein
MARREIQNPMDQDLMWYKLTCLVTKVLAISHPALREESREEAKPKGHLLCHMPKNTFCKTLSAGQNVETFIPGIRGVDAY